MFTQVWAAMFVRHVWAHPNGQKHATGSPYIWVKHFSSDISYMKHSSDLNLGESLCIFTSFHFPDSGLCLLNGFDFFLSILNGVTLKTSNMSALLEIARIYKARKLFADLQRPICYKDPQNSLLIIFTLRPNFGNRWISRIGSLQFWWNSVQHKALRKNVNDSRILTQTPKRRGTITTWHLLQSPNILCYIVDFFLCYPCYMSDLRSK